MLTSTRMPSAWGGTQQKWEAPEMGCHLLGLMQRYMKYTQGAFCEVQCGWGHKLGDGANSSGNFFVKALRSRVLFSTSRTVKGLSNKPIGCGACVNMAWESCLKCWRLLEVAALLGYLSLMSLLLFFGRGWECPIFLGFFFFFCLISFYEFLPWIPVSAT